MDLAEKDIYKSGRMDTCDILVYYIIFYGIFGVEGGFFFSRMQTIDRKSFKCYRCCVFV